MRTHHYILLLFALLLSTVSSCSDEPSAVLDTTVHYAISLSDSWTDGLSHTRAMATRVTAPAGPGETPKDDYPSKIFVTATKLGEDTKQYTLSQSSDDEEATTGFIQYHTIDPSDNSLSLSEALEYSFTVKSQLPKSNTAPEWADNNIPAISTIDYLKAEGVPSDDANADVYHQGNHIFFRLRHQTALIRFVLGVDAEYLNIRDFELTRLKLSADLSPTPAAGADPITFTPSDLSIPYVASLPLKLSSDGTNILEFYVEPKKYAALNDKTLTLTATYDVYDKSGQLTRKDCKASNKITSLTSFFKNGDAPVSLSPGNYYDILVTLAPDFLYVLSDNDNKSDLELK